MVFVERVATNGAELAVRVDGDRGLPWIVLSNSLACTHHSWRLQMSALTNAYRVLRYDARGHGKSSTPAGPYTMDILVGDLLGLMDHFQIGRADVLGLSMGGMTALGLAIARPDRVHRLICCGARADTPPDMVDIWNSRIAAIREAGMEGEVSSSLKRWFTRGCHENQPEVIADAAQMIRATDPNGYIACVEALKALDYKAKLKEIVAPTLFMTGAHDIAAPPAVIRELAMLVPTAAYAEIEPGAHICMLENPAAFNRAIAGWLRI
jgi:3-oxoadipate enol-lactonase